MLIALVYLLGAAAIKFDHCHSKQSLHLSKSITQCLWIIVFFQLCLHLRWSYSVFCLVLCYNLTSPIQFQQGDNTLSISNIVVAVVRAIVSTAIAKELAFIPSTFFLLAFGLLGLNGSHSHWYRRFAIFFAENTAKPYFSISHHLLNEHWYASFLPVLSWDITILL